MKVSSIDIESNINNIKAQIEADNTLSPSMRTAMWTSQILLDTFNSYNVTSNRGVYEQRQTVYRRV
jgi:hypothetical protein